MQNDPYKNFYIKGLEDAQSGKKSRVPYNFKLSYVSGRCDFVSGKKSIYESK
jgi:hypothetical protein